MTITPFFIAGLLDGPWVVIALVVGGAIVNWLNKRREEKAAEATRTPPAAEKPPADWEERLRRLLGEEPAPAPAPRPSAPPAQSAPPLRRPGAQPPNLRPGESRPAPLRRPPPIEVVPVAGPAAEQVSGGGVDETVRRFEQLDPGVMTPVRPITALRGTRGPTLGLSLRQPQAARQAFVASLVFGAPKGLED